MQIRHAECSVGASGRDAALLLIYTSVCGAVSGVLVGYIGDYVSNRIMLLQLIMFSSGIVNICFPFFKTYSELVGYSILVGVFGSFRMLVAVIPRDIVGLEEIVNAWGIYSLIAGVVAAAGPPFGGMCTLVLVGHFLINYLCFRMDI